MYGFHDCPACDRASTDGWGLCGYHVQEARLDGLLSSFAPWNLSDEQVATNALSNMMHAYAECFGSELRQERGR